MKKLLSLLFILGLALSACGTSQTQSAPPAQTSTPSPTQTVTQTPIPPTDTVTPLPTIPTFTPTFDVSTIVTVTPAEKAECPTIQSDVNMNLSKFDDYYPELITALNQGASIETIIDIFEKRITQHDNPDGNVIFKEKIDYEIVDLTGDGIPEVILLGNQYRQKKSLVLGCDMGEYKVILSRAYPSFHGTYLLPVDANQNGITEIIIVDQGGSGIGSWFNLSIIEWQAGVFRTLLAEVTSDSVFDSIQVNDLDNDGTKEIYWRFHSYLYSPPPWRRGTITFKWNGEQFIELLITYDPAQYRFQAIQDGDIAILNENFIQAEKSYLEAISNDQLEWWSPQRADDTMYNINNEGWNAVGTAAPGNPDPAEYPRLAAYAYYRIMLLQLVQGQEAEAASTYQILQETFGTDPYAASYVEMASAFWESYQSTYKMYNGCAAAIQYAVEHPEILVPLGSDYHGWQSHIYEPADVCPFR